ncbi:anti-sigma factor [Pseudoduganella ginsengisoli]|uniref:Anti-sigma factor n=1 Tax=Pseudoduganella ginsengisoli TaxID=1462440 RepID=A0A6L6Q8T2_9BURK|nr:anti-sigma factor [Pseudoduganella ginsengisoli]MTW05641.1 anti-sigma factor [Pseudoduganella ginsengisoli]
MKKPLIPDEELNAFVDGELPSSQRDDVAAWLEQDPSAAATARAYGAQELGLKQLFGAVAHEAVPERLLAAARAPADPQAAPLSPAAQAMQAVAALPSARTEQAYGPLPRWSLYRMAAGVLLAVCGGAAGWVAHSHWQAQTGVQLAAQGNGREAAAMPTFARQAAVAHAVYSPDVRRPVEITAEQEEQLVTWLSKRLKASVRPPKLGALGYDLIGGRLLPGASGPVAQFMYNDATGRRITLYVSADNKDNKDTAFRFAQEGDVSVFYWIDGRFGYALSANIGKAELARLATAVYGQLEHKAAD